MIDFDFVQVDIDFVQVDIYFVQVDIDFVQVDIDFSNSAFFIIFTVVAYPPGVDYELNDNPDAIRPLQEVNIKGIVSQIAWEPPCKDGNAWFTTVE